MTDRHTRTHTFSCIHAHKNYTPIHIHTIIETKNILNLYYRFSFKTINKYHAVNKNIYYFFIYCASSCIKIALQLNLDKAIKMRKMVFLLIPLSEFLPWTGTLHYTLPDHLREHCLSVSDD